MRTILFGLMMLALTGVGSNPFPGTGLPRDAVLPPTGWQTPYNPNPFNTPICGTDPSPTVSCTPNKTVDPSSASEISSIFTLVGGFALGEIQQRQPGTTGTSGIAGSFPVYYASSLDPTYTVTCDGTVGDCTQFPLTIHLPNGARGAGTADHHLVVIEPDQNFTEVIFEQFNDGGTGTGTTTPVSGGGTISAKGGGYATSLTMFASGGTCGNCHGIAPRFPIQPSLLDPLEIVNGQISHAIAIALYAPSSSFFWPAAASDGPNPTGPGEGEYIWLNLTDTQINALGFCSWETTILKAMHHYGLLIADTGAGPEPWNFYSYDDAGQVLWNGVGNWTLFFNWLTTSCPSANPSFSSNASHLQLLTTGISQSNLQIVE